MEDNRTSLLGIEAEYYENCPGCKTDRLKEEQTGVPYRQLSFIWLVSLCTGQYFILTLTVKNGTDFKVLFFF